jgi:hypothetical protein
MEARQMKKCDEIQRAILAALAAGDSVFHAVALVEVTHQCYIAPKRLESGWEFTVYYTRLGNATKKAIVFTVGFGYLPTPNKPKMSKSQSILGRINQWFRDSFGVLT